MLANLKLIHWVYIMGFNIRFFMAYYCDIHEITSIKHGNHRKSPLFTTWIVPSMFRRCSGATEAAAKGNRILSLARNEKTARNITGYHWFLEVKTLRQTPGNGDGNGNAPIYIYNGNVPISDEMTQKLHNSAYQLVKTRERLRSLVSRLSSLD